MNYQRLKDISAMNNYCLGKWDILSYRYTKNGTKFYDFMECEKILGWAATYKAWDGSRSLIFFWGRGCTTRA